ncbi:MAG: NUDIX hydrolase [Candidatus Moranbacteria bacterium]|nr:NUDIX hydrolase [Candidatus Moranbacteria bacterium]
MRGMTVIKLEMDLQIKTASGELSVWRTLDGKVFWSFKEEGGGGSIIVPYAFIDQQFYVGMLLQHRPNQDGWTLNIPRGGKRKGETHMQAAERELAEELGISSSSLTILDGDPMNPNSTHFKTSGDDGVQVFACELDSNLIIFDGILGLYKIDPFIVCRNKSMDDEGVEDCYLLPWKIATKVGDMFSLAAISRLLAKII